MGSPDAKVDGPEITPAEARACFVLAHGAGAGMTHPFMQAFADGLSERGIATLRYQFPYMEKGGKRADPPKLGQATVPAAVGAAAAIAAYRGRQAQAAAPLPKVSGLAFLGFPLHPAGRPSNERGQHPFEIHIPMLFLQGTRDALADMEELKPLCQALGVRAALKLFQDADLSFHVPARSGRTDAHMRKDLLDALAQWIHVRVEDQVDPGAPEPKGRSS
jgi:predicted alpha/beta-hydrolase family hydrolase